MKTPSFFNRVKRISAGFSALCASITLTYGDQLPPMVDKIVEYGIVAGIVSMAIAQFTVEKPEDLHKNDPV
jgi:hypothetical protein